MLTFNNFSSVEEAVTHTLTHSQASASFDFSFSLKGRVNFKRVGWIVFLTLAFFDSQLGLLHFGKPDEVEPYRRNLPQAVKPAAIRNDRGDGKKPKKPQSKKKRCL